MIFINSPEKPKSEVPSRKLQEYLVRKDCSRHGKPG